MYEGFTDRSRKVMRLANQEANRLNHEYIGTEHVLLGLIKEGSGVAANVLNNGGVDLRKIRIEVEKIVQAGTDMVTMGKLPHTPRAIKVIEYAVQEARNLDHNDVGTEHLLLGLLRVDDGVGVQVLVNLGLRPDGVREEVLNLLGHGIDESSSTKRRESVRALLMRGSLSAASMRDVLRRCEDDLGPLHDDVDYIRHLASELAACCDMRTSRKGADFEFFDEDPLADLVGLSLDQSLAGILAKRLFDEKENRRDRLIQRLRTLPGFDAQLEWPEIERECERFDLWREKKEEHVADQEFTAAAGTREEADQIKGRVETRFRARLATLVDQTVPGPPPRSRPAGVPLSDFARARLALFWAEQAFEDSDIATAAGLLATGLEQSLERILSERLQPLIEHFIEGIAVLEGTVPTEPLEACRAKLTKLRSKEPLSFTECANLVQEIQRSINDLAGG